MAIDWNSLQQSLSNIGNQTSQLWWTNEYLRQLETNLGSFSNGLLNGGLASSTGSINVNLKNLSNEFSGVGAGITSVSTGITNATSAINNASNSIAQIPNSIGAFGNAFNQNITNIANVANQDVAAIGKILGNAEGTFTNLSNSFSQIGAETAGIGNTINAIQNWDWKKIGIRGGLIIVGVIILIVGITKL